MRDRLTGKKPRVPVAGRHVWDWFWRLDRTREGTGYGINPLQPSQIESWMRQRKIHPLPWHLDAIDRLDTTRMRLYFEKKGDEDQPEQAEVSSRPLSANLFDALFPAKRK